MKTASSPASAFVCIGQASNGQWGSSLSRNIGLQKRYYYTKESMSFDMEGTLMEDLFSLDKFLINGLDVFIKLYRSNPKFSLMSQEADADYKIVLEDVIFKVCKVKVDLGIIMAHAIQIEQQLVQYYLNRSKVKMNTVAANTNEFMWDNIFKTPDHPKWSSPFYPKRLLAAAMRRTHSTSKLLTLRNSVCTSTERACRCIP